MSKSPELQGLDRLTWTNILFTTYRHKMMCGDKQYSVPDLDSETGGIASRMRKVIIRGVHQM